MMGDLPEWKRERVVSFFGWPTQIKKRWRMVSFLWVTYPEKKYGLIVMGDLPKEKGRVVSFFGWPTQGKEWPHSYGWPTQINKNGEWSHSYGWPTQKSMVSLWWVTYPSRKKEEWSHSLGDLPDKKNTWKWFQQRASGLMKTSKGNHLYGLRFGW